MLDGCKAEVMFGFWTREARASAAGFPSGAWEPVAWEPVAWESVAREVVRFSVADRYVGKLSA